MGKRYGQEPQNPQKCVKSKASEIKVHFKNAFHVCRVIRKMRLTQAQRYLKDVLAKKRCIPFTRYNGHVGRTAQATEFNVTQGRWPQKAVKAVLSILQNLEANAHVKQLDPKRLELKHVQINRAASGRRRTYRAHGRINAFLSHPCHIEMWAVEKPPDVKKPKKDTATRKAQLVRKRVPVGPRH